MPKFLADYLGLLGVLLVLIAIFGFSTDHFFSLTTFRSIANQVPDALVIAMGMTLVLILGGIDLSVGSVLAFSGAVLGICLGQWEWPLYLAIMAAVGTGAACGAINGAIVARWPIPSFIITLGMLEAARGGTYLITNSQTQYLGAKITVIADEGILGLSLPFFLAMIVITLTQVMLSSTVFGRHLYAAGANEEASRLSGIPVRRVKFVVFTACGAFAGLASVIYCARMSAADPNGGIGYELNAIAAVVIGGTSLLGGRGSAIGTFLGVVIIAVLENGLVQLGAQDPAKRIITGAVIVIAVIIDFYRDRARRKA